MGRLSWGIIGISGLLLLIGPGCTFNKTTTPDNDADQGDPFGNKFLGAEGESAESDVPSAEPDATAPAPERTDDQKAAYEGDDPGECDDGADNDLDGLFDCYDPACVSSPDCQGEVVEGGGTTEGGNTEEEGGNTEEGGGTTEGGNTEEEGGNTEEGGGTTEGGNTEEEGGNTEEEGGEEGPQPDCIGDLDCPNGHMCEDGECVASPEPECTVDPDCPDGHVCEDETCVGDKETCIPSSTIACGQTLEAHTGEDGYENIIEYSCSTWWESGPEIAYTFEAQTSQTVTAVLKPLTGVNNLDLFLLLETGNGCNAYNCQAKELYSEIEWEATAGTTYYLVVDGFSEAKGLFELTLVCGGEQP